MRLAAKLIKKRNENEEAIIKRGWMKKQAEKAEEDCLKKQRLCLPSNSNKKRSSVFNNLVQLFAFSAAPEAEKQNIK